MPVVLLLFLFSCGDVSQETDHPDPPGQPEDLPEHLRDLENLTVYPEDAGSLYSVRFVPVDTLDYQGRDLFAVDEQNRIIVPGDKSLDVYHPGGEFVTSLGREGSGPGEFQSFSIIEPKLESNRVYGFDRTLRLINVYSLDTFEFLHAILIDPRNWSHIDELAGAEPDPHDYYVRSDSTILMGFLEPFYFGQPVPEGGKPARYCLLDMEGHIVPPGDRIFRRMDLNFSRSGLGAVTSVSSTPLPSTRNSLMTVSEKGYIYSASADEFLIRVHDPAGNYLHAFYYPFRQNTLDRETVIDTYFDDPDPGSPAYRHLLQSDFPDTWPALHYMFVDDEDHLWVATIIDDDEHFEWWILEQDGTLLARFLWPGERYRRHRGEQNIRTVRNGYLYAIEPSNWQMETRVVRYKIEMEEV